MSQFKNVEVVMLPTNQKAGKDDILYMGVSRSFFFMEGKWNGFLDHDDVKHHLYFLSDEEIKVGDWYINMFNAPNHRTVQTHSELRHLINHKKDYRFRDCKKVIATTDESLKINTDLGEISKENILPQPSKSFIEKYIEAYNAGKPITKVLVEYEEYAVESFGMAADLEPTIDIRLKVNPKDNTITIKPIKSSWTREEVIELILEALDCHNKGEIFTKTDLIDWANKNL